MAYVFWVGMIFALILIFAGATRENPPGQGTAKVLIAWLAVLVYGFHTLGWPFSG